jgi:hypothetical protein
VCLLRGIGQVFIYTIISDYRQPLEGYKSQGPPLIVYLYITDTGPDDTSQEDHFGDAWAYFYHDQYIQEAMGGAAPS